MEPKNLNDLLKDLKVLDKAIIETDYGIFEIKKLKEIEQ